MKTEKIIVVLKNWGTIRLVEFVQRQLEVKFWNKRCGFLLYFFLVNSIFKISWLLSCLNQVNQRFRATADQVISALKSRRTGLVSTIFIPQLEIKLINLTDWIIVNKLAPENQTTHHRQVNKCLTDFYFIQSFNFFNSNYVFQYCWWKCWKSWNSWDPI